MPATVVKHFQYVNLSIPLSIAFSNPKIVGFLFLRKIG